MKKIFTLPEIDSISHDIIDRVMKSKIQKTATVIALSGDLGAGKTTLTKTVAKILGVKKTVNSPTFVIMKSYALSDKKYTKMFHIDAYRLKNEKELLHLGWTEIISNPEHIVFIEWPENVAKAMPKKYHTIKIAHLPAQAGTKEGKRKIEMK